MSWRNSNLREKLLTPMTLGKLGAYTVFLSAMAAAGLWATDSAIEYVSNGEGIFSDDTKIYEYSLVGTMSVFAVLSALAIAESYYKGYGNDGLRHL